MIVSSVEHMPVFGEACGMEELSAAADRFAVGRIYPEDLPMVAAAALVRGLDSPALRELAGIHRSDCRDAPQVFLTALVELGIADMSEADWSIRQHQVATQLLAVEEEHGEVSHDIALLLHLLAFTPEPSDTTLHEWAGCYGLVNADCTDGYHDRAVVAIDRLRRAAQYLSG